MGSLFTSVEIKNKVPDMPHDGGYASKLYISLKNSLYKENEVLTEKMTKYYNNDLQYNHSHPQYRKNTFSIRINENVFILHCGGYWSGNTYNHEILKSLNEFETWGKEILKNIDKENPIKLSFTGESDKVFFNHKDVWNELGLL